MPYKQLTIDQMAYIINHAEDRTALEISSKIKVSPGKVISEIKKLNKIPVTRRKKTYSFGRPLRDKIKYVPGLTPKPEFILVRPKAVYTNQRFLYSEIAEIK